MRIDSEKPMKNGGYFHAFEEGRPKRELPIADKSHLEQVRPDFGALTRRWRSEERDDRMAGIAENIGLPEAPLRMLGITWSPYSHAMAFPMYDATCGTGDAPCGIRLRTMDGAKFAIKHSKSGIFFPYGALKWGAKGCERIFICEGPTDTAACLSMGLFAIGRAACRGGEEIVLSVLNQLRPRECVIVSDNDGPGVEGAGALMEKIEIPKTRLIPPGKDLRAFVRDGGTKAVLESLLKNTLTK